jgi:hypothetical protein
MVIVSIVAMIAALLGATGGYVLSKQAVQWCPACGRSLAGHCPESVVTGPFSVAGRLAEPATRPQPSR